MAVVFNTCLGVIMLIPDSSSISNLLDYFSFAMWLIYFMTFVSLIVFRFKEPYKSKERAFRIWLPIPIICACISAYLVIGPLIGKSKFVGIFFIFQNIQLQHTQSPQRWLLAD
jgi:L-type amino acid transporter 9